MRDDSAPVSVWVDAEGLRELRAVVRSKVSQLMTPDRADDFVAAVYELAANVVKHGGGVGWIEISREGGELVCEVRDRGPGMVDPTAGTAPPAVSSIGGYGLWMVRQLCTTVTVNTSERGTAVRIGLKLS